MSQRKLMTELCLTARVSLSLSRSVYVCMCACALYINVRNLYHTKCTQAMMILCRLYLCTCMFLRKIIIKKKKKNKKKLVFLDFFVVFSYPSLRNAYLFSLWCSMCGSLIKERREKKKKWTERVLIEYTMSSLFLQLQLNGRTSSTTMHSIRPINANKASKGKSQWKLLNKYTKHSLSIKKSVLFALIVT